MYHNELEPCPFCGEMVVFRQIHPYAIFEGKCDNCTMQFRYEEKEEECAEECTSGEIKIRYTFPKKKRLNLPFYEAWNRRVSK